MHRARRKALLSALAFACAATAVTAGTRQLIEVSINDTAAQAQGVLGDARASSGYVQSIGCWTTQHSGLCHAIDENSRVRTCASNDPEQLAIMRSLGTDSLLRFSWAKDGSCSTLMVSNSSSFRAAANSGL